MDGLLQSRTGKYGNERIFETTISSIFNDGTGWHCVLKGLCFEVSVLAFGKTVFLT